MADATPGTTKMMASLLAGAAVTVFASVLNHVDPAALGDGWAQWIVLGLRQSDAMSGCQTILTTVLVYFVPSGSPST